MLIWQHIFRSTSTASHAFSFINAEAFPEDHSEGRKICVRSKSSTNHYSQALLRQTKPCWSKGRSDPSSNSWKWCLAFGRKNQGNLASQELRDLHKEHYPYDRLEWIRYLYMKCSAILPVNDNKSANDQWWGFLDVSTSPTWLPPTITIFVQAWRLPNLKEGTCLTLIVPFTETIIKPRVYQDDWAWQGGMVIK